MSTPAGWYDDGKGRQRWWDGTGWTDNYQPVMQVPAPPVAGSVAYPVSAPPPRSAPKNFWGVLSLIAGIVGILLAWMVFGGVVGIAGAIFGAVGLAAVKNGMATNKGLSIWGIVLSGVSMLLALLFLVVYIGLGAWVASEDDSEAGTAGSGTGVQTEGPDPAAPESGGGDYAFPVGDGYTMELSISPVQLDPPQGFQGAEPTQTEYDFFWNNAQETGGQLAVVTLTIHNNNDYEAPVTPVVVTLMKKDLTEIPHWGAVEEGYDLDLFNLEVPAGESQTWKIAYVLPASEIDTVAVETLFQEDIGEGHRVTAVQPDQGEGCGQVPGEPDDPFKIWTCLRKG